MACGPCNRVKGSRYAVLNETTVAEYFRTPQEAVRPPPNGPAALINPRAEDPLDFLELDLGGTTPGGDELAATFEFLPSDAATPKAKERAKYSIAVLGLNREVIRVARENVSNGFRARLREYVHEKSKGAPRQRLDSLRNDLLSTPHLTVFAEMRRQKAYLPAIAPLFARAPEAEAWPLVPP